MKNTKLMAVLTAASMLAVAPVPQAAAASATQKSKGDSYALCTVEYTTDERELMGGWLKKGAEVFLKTYDSRLPKALASKDVSEARENVKEVIDSKATATELELREAAGETLSEQEATTLDTLRTNLEDVKNRNYSWGGPKFTPVDWALNIGWYTGVARFVAPRSNQDAANVITQRINYGDPSEGIVVYSEPLNKDFTLDQQVALHNEASRALAPEVYPYQTAKMDDAMLLISAPFDYARILGGRECSAVSNDYTTDHPLQERRDSYADLPRFPKDYTDPSGGTVTADGYTSPYAGRHVLLDRIIFRETVDKNYTMARMYNGWPWSSNKWHTIGIAVAIIAAIAAVIGAAPYILNALKQLK